MTECQHKFFNDVGAQRLHMAAREFMAAGAVLPPQDQLQITTRSDVCSVTILPALL